MVAVAGVLVQSGVLHGRYDQSAEEEYRVALNTSSPSRSVLMFVWVARMSAFSSSVTIHCWARVCT